MLEYELVDKNYARTFNLSDDVIKDVKEAKKHHIDFYGWRNKNYGIICMILIMWMWFWSNATSGWRPQELGLIELKM